MGTRMRQDIDRPGYEDNKYIQMGKGLEIEIEIAGEDVGNEDGDRNRRRTPDGAEICPPPVRSNGRRARGMHGMGPSRPRFQYDTVCLWLRGCRGNHWSTGVDGRCVVLWMREDCSDARCRCQRRCVMYSRRMSMPMPMVMRYAVCDTCMCPDAYTASC